MSAAIRRLDAVDAAINATFPKPGNWRWEVRQGERSVELGTHANEAMTFARWGTNGAQPLFLTRTNGLSILRDASEFLRPIPGREHHEWAKRIDHPIANVIALGVNLLEPLAAVARAAIARPWLYADRTCVRCESSTGPETRPGSHTKECPFGDLDAALDALEADSAGKESP